MKIESFSNRMLNMFGSVIFIRPQLLFIFAFVLEMTTKVYENGKRLNPLRLPFCAFVQLREVEAQIAPRRDNVLSPLSISRTRALVGDAMELHQSNFKRFAATFWILFHRVVPLRLLAAVMVRFRFIFGCVRAFLRRSPHFSSYNYNFAPTGLHRAECNEMNGGEWTPLITAFGRSAHKCFNDSFPRGEKRAEEAGEGRRGLGRWKSVFVNRTIYVEIFQLQKGQPNSSSPIAYFKLLHWKWHFQLLASLAQPFFVVPRLPQFFGIITRK